MPCVVIDTGGLIENPKGIEAQMRAQTERAVAEADRLMLLADARAGLTPAGLSSLRASCVARASQSTLALNKAEGLDPDLAAADFHALGLGAAGGDLREPRRRAARS